MNARQFFDTVAAMRQAQKDYFKSKSQDDLNRLKELQRLVEAEIARVKAISPPVYKQGDFF